VVERAAAIETIEQLCDCEATRRVFPVSHEDFAFVVWIAVRLEVRRPAESTSAAATQAAWVLRIRPILLCIGLFSIFCIWTGNRGF
jgi:hypothetical protein